MIIAGKYMDAMDVAKKQVADGAHVIDINVDDGMVEKDRVNRFTNYVHSSEAE